MANTNAKEILIQENALLDCVLEYQSRLHSAVKEKDWVGLEKIMSDINTLTAKFSELDAARDALISSGSLLTTEEAELAFVLRAKLLKSKVENQALNTYIEATQKFVRGVLENAIPQRRNVLYSRSGRIVKEEPKSVVLNQVL